MPSSRFVTCISPGSSSYRLKVEISETLFCASGNIEPCHNLVVSPWPHHPCRSPRHPQLFSCSKSGSKTLFPTTRCSWTSVFLFLMGLFVNVVSQSVSECNAYDWLSRVPCSLTLPAASRRSLYWASVQATVAKALKKPSFSIHVTNLSPEGIAISLSSFSEKKT